jgi:hypothetical protein
MGQQDLQRDFTVDVSQGRKWKRTRDHVRYDLTQISYGAYSSDIRFVQDHQPPIVACDFDDAEGHHHTLVDKVLIFRSEWLSPDSKYPQPGSVRCEILGRWRDVSGRELVRITIEKPDHVESTKGLSEFLVVSSQLSESLINSK